MSHIRSLRSRLLVGSIFWTIGLLFFAHFLAVHLVHWYYDGPLVLVLSRQTFFLFWSSMSLLALAAMAVGYRHVRRGISTLDRLRERLTAVRAGQAARIDGDYPSEVAPLVDDLNALLEHREEVVRRALAKSGDLAHGLKTPLAVVAQEAARAAEAGQLELAETLDQQVRRMRRQVDYHLAQARAAGAGATLGARASALESATALTRTLARLHAGRAPSFVVRVSPEHAVRVEREDLDEMLGNLLDNACKWARSIVEVDSALADGRIVLTVDDDGAGIAPELSERVLQRGVRADEAAPGSGLGLAIVGDLAELYGGSIRLERAPVGGVRARLELPAA